MSRVENEREFHNNRFEGGISKPSRYYKALKNWNSDYFDYIERSSHGEILELGSGLESICIKLHMEKRFKITSIDISEEAIGSMTSLGYSNCSFFVMDAHRTAFEDRSFDLVCGKGVLHHLDLKLAITEVKRLIRSGGGFIFAEPLDANFLINLYRYFTPKIRTSDEKPLNIRDIEYIKLHLENVGVKYYGFFTLFFSVFNLTSPSIVFKLDNLLLNSMRLGKYLAWSCLIYKRRKP